MYKSVLVGLTALVGLTLASPTPVEVAPRCGTTYYPTILQQLSENQPNTVQKNTVGAGGEIKVQQSISGDGNPYLRTYQIVAFQNIPQGSYGCQLALSIPQGYPVVFEPNTSPSVQLNVTTVLKDNPSAIAYPNSWTWNNAAATLGFGGTGTFGTVSVAPGTSAVINSEACASNLAFLLEVSPWTGGRFAGVQFAQQNSPLAGFYLTTNC